MTEQEALIREAITAEADQAADYRSVLANLHGKRSRRRPIALIAATALTVAAAVAAVVVPLSVDRTASTPPVQPAAPGNAQTVLLIGLDDSVNTDSIVLARFDPEGSFSAVSLPRDSWVDIPGVGMGKLNSAYVQAHTAAQAEGRDGDAAGAEALVRTVEALTGVEIDHYAAVDMADFAALSDAVGGVEVCLNAATRDAYSGADLPAGRQTLSGDRALAFLRQRMGLTRGELDRVVRQQAFLHGLVAKLKGEEGDPAKLARLVGAARVHVRTDPGWDLLDFAARLTSDVPVRTATMPVGEPVQAASGWYLQVSPDLVRSFVAGFLTDTPGSTPAPTAPPVTGEPTPNGGCVN
jgi:LCP family protein required for cell wall assembly